MLMSALLEGEGLKLLILVPLALLIAGYLWYLGRREKKEKETVVPLTAESLTALPDEALLNTVVKDLLSDCDAARDDPYRRTAFWTNEQVNVYSVWLTVKELAAAPFEKVAGTASGRFLELAADSFSQIGAPLCEAAVRNALSGEAADPDGAFAAAVSEEDPLALCVPYIRDNLPAFIKGVSDDELSDPQ